MYHNILNSDNSLESYLRIYGDLSLVWSIYFGDNDITNKLLEENSLRYLIDIQRDDGYCNYEHDALLTACQKHDIKSIKKIISIILKYIKSDSIDKKLAIEILNYNEPDAGFNVLQYLIEHEHYKT